MKSRAICRNCGVETTKFKKIAAPDPSTRGLHGAIASWRPKTIPVCRDVEKCRRRYDQKNGRLQRHAAHLRQVGARP